MDRLNAKKKIYPEHRQKVVVALSGGVDSSVSAALLKGQGYDVIGVFMRVWSGLQTNDYRLQNKSVDGRLSTVDVQGQCPWIEDQFEARRAAEHLGIPFYTINLEKEYKDAVVDYFFQEYRAGRTPNPDVLCNSEIKFGVFLKRMLEMGADYVATGHYVRIAQIPNDKIQISSKFQNPNDRIARNFEIRHSKLDIDLTFDILNSSLKPKDYSHAPSQNKLVLLRGLDPRKDQTYFLWKLTPDQLSHVIFPVGGYRKDQVREMAKKFGLPNSDRKDSQGICFIGPVDVAEFLKTQLPVKKGKVVTNNGQVIGGHDGVWFYTIGQRQGVIQRVKGVKGLKGDKGDFVPLYVVDKDINKNVLVVGPADDPMLWAKGMMISQLNWLTNSKLKTQNSKLQCQCQIRYQQLPVNCLIQAIDDDQLKVIFHESVRAVTPGQSAVFYQGELVLGGGIIEGAMFK